MDILKKKKIVLAYSGGLDTSVILKWLEEKYDAEIVVFTADIGQGEEVEEARQKALAMGIKAENIFIEDLKDEFVKDYVYPMFRANTLYEGTYLLGTSIARPIISKKQIEIAKRVGADFVCHGATGKGNDQVRFELSYYALNPYIKVIAPWREWDLNSRQKLLDYARSHNIEVSSDKENEPPYSMDANLLHISYEGKMLEDPWITPDKSFLRRVKPLENVTKNKELIELEFEKGDVVSLNGKRCKPYQILDQLNKIGAEHGIGVSDIVENRFVGIKSRGVYETPGGTILLTAHRAIESITLDREACHLKDELMPKYAKMIYNGFWFSPEREMLQALIDKSQENVYGTVKIALYKGNVIVEGRKSECSLYREDLATFEEDNVYNHQDAEGFIKLNALRLKILDNYSKR